MVNPWTLDDKAKIKREQTDKAPKRKPNVKVVRPLKRTKSKGNVPGYMAGGKVHSKPKAKKPRSRKR